MTRLFSGYGEYRNAAGQLVVEFGAPIGLHLIGVLVLPPAAAGVHLSLTGGGPMGTPWFVLWAAIAVSLAGAAFLVLFFARRSRVRVIVDRSAGRLAVEAVSGRTELPLRDAVRAEMVATEAPVPDQTGTSGTTVTIGNASATTYRLDIVRQSGERVAATAASFSGYREQDRERLLDTINRELKLIGSATG